MSELKAQHWSLGRFYWSLGRVLLTLSSLQSQQLVRECFTASEFPSTAFSSQHTGAVELICFLGKRSTKQIKQHQNKQTKLRPK